MAEGGSDSPFDLEQLRQVVEMMDKHGLTDVSLRKGGVHWRLRRGGPEVPMMAYAQPVQQAMMPAAAPQPRSAAEAPAASHASPANDGLLVIKSPAVGTFYPSPTPDEPPFVSIGSKVTPTTTVCLIEAMKVFNQIPAEVSGTITEILVQNGDAVEFGHPLFKVRP